MASASNHARFSAQRLVLVLMLGALPFLGCDSEFFDALGRWLGGECIPACADGYVCNEGLCELEAGELTCSPACSDGYVCRYGACVASESSDGVEHTTGGRSWTVMVYLVGDNDLESFAVGDLEEMMEVGASDDFRIVVQADRAQGYSSADVGWLGDFTGTKRLEVNANNGLTEIADLGEQNMADPEVLADFIDWGLSNYPADQTAIVFWNHGAGWVGFGVDEASSGHPLLSLSQLKQGISQGLQRVGLSHFQVIGFDACLMANYAVAATLAPFGEYLLASEELEPGHGWNYTGFSAVRNDPSMGATELAAAVMGSYRNQAVNYGTEGSITLSLVDLTRMASVEAAVEDFAYDLVANAGDTAAYVGQSRTNAVRFGKAPDPAYDANLVDLGDFAKLVQNESGVFGTTQGAVASALSSAVISKVSGPSTTDAAGLSIYFPPNSNYYSSTYDTFPEVEGWRTFLRGYFSGGSQLDRGVSFAASGGSASLSWDSGYVTVRGSLSSGSSNVLTDAYAQFGLALPNEGGTLLLIGAVAELDGDVLEQSWSGLTVTLAQGEAPSYGYYDLTFDDGGSTAVVEIPFAYDTPAFNAPAYVVLQYVVDMNTEEIVSAVYYEVDENGVGELYAEAGYVLLPLVPVGVEGNPASWEWMTLADEAFDATAEIEVYFDDIFAQLEPGDMVHAQLSAGDYGGNDDLIWGQIAVE